MTHALQDLGRMIAGGDGGESGAGVWRIVQFGVAAYHRGDGEAALGGELAFLGRVPSRIPYASIFISICEEYGFDGSSISCLF